jgi:NifU-like protein involved in Fe-S cluster formation
MRLSCLGPFDIVSRKVEKKALCDRMTAAKPSVHTYIRKGQQHGLIMDDIYNAKILDFAGNIGRVGTLPDAQAVAEKHSKLCGSRVKVYLKLADGVVSDFSHEVKACALGQASSGIMARHVVGATPEELRTARRDMLAMLKEAGEGPSGRFEDMRFLKPVRDYKARHASTMLTFDAVVDCLDQIDHAHRAAEAS